MLCDDVLALDTQDWDHLTEEGNEFWRKIRPEFQICHKFFLTEEFFFLSEDMQAGDSSDRKLIFDNLLDHTNKIKHLAKLPFETVWIETRVQSKRVGWFLIDRSHYILALMFLDIGTPKGEGIQLYSSAFSPSNPNNLIKFLFLNYQPDEESTLRAYCQAMTLMDVLARINSPSITSIGDKVDLSRLNKARRKKSKPPLHEYRIVDLSKSVKMALSQCEERGLKKKLHWVRGHFKIRKTGMYWWSPHLAGRKELGMIDKDYAA